MAEKEGTGERSPMTHLGQYPANRKVVITWTERGKSTGGERFPGVLPTGQQTRHYG